MAYRLAKSLETLRSQVNAAYPNRSKVSDGWIGDTSHSARKSDHNPNASGVVQAIDITHDPEHGFDSYAFADLLRRKRDHRIKYVISNRRIFSSLTQPWTWRPYSGANAHAHHVHVSVNDDPAEYDSSSLWDISAEGLDLPTVLPPPIDEIRLRMARYIVAWEARRTIPGNHLAVYQPSDGSHEIAGINDRSHPAEYEAVKALLDAGRHDEAERRVEQYVVRYTEVAAGWTPIRVGAEWTTELGVEFFLRDCCFNRGPTGAAMILQRAVGVEADGQVGPQTRAAMARLQPLDLLQSLRAAREAYEVTKYGRREALWAGLVSRWDKALAAAREFQQETGPVPEPHKPPTPPVPVSVQSGRQAVAWVQKALNLLGADPPLECDGMFGSASLAMVRIFQDEKGLMVTGLPNSTMISEVEAAIKKNHIGHPPLDEPSRTILRSIFG